jgi:hypothetical protein
MIECPTCKVSFSPRHRVCPRCKAYEARLEDRVHYLTDTAETALDQGVSPDEVASKLLEEGVPSLRAHHIVCAGAQKVRRIARRHALVRLLCGLGLLLLASICVVPGFFLWPLGLGISAGILLGAVGAWAFILGIYGLITARDR